MDKDTKVTYITISALIILLGGIAFFLQNSDEIVEEVKKDTLSIKTQVKTQPTSATATTTATTTTNQATTTMEEPQKIAKAIITTNMGTIEVSFAENTPNTVKNFVTLAQSKFYDGVRFHRVIKNFMIQTGDPLSKDPSKMSMWGTGGPDYRFADELYGNEKYSYGTLAMANAGPNTNGSQFFIVTANPGYPLPPNYTVFGKVIKGMDVAEKIQNVKTGASDRPVEDVIIEKVDVIK